jgi:uncharacterized repeat protein (TIGR04052 family)
VSPSSVRSLLTSTAAFGLLGSLHAGCGDDDSVQKQRHGTGDYYITVPVTVSDAGPDAATFPPRSQGNDAGNARAAGHVATAGRGGAAANGGKAGGFSPVPPADANLGAAPNRPPTPAADGGGNSGLDSGTSALPEPPSGSIRVSVHFEATLAGEAFACGRSYDGIGLTKTSVTPQDLRMFVQDLKLVTDKREEVPVQLDLRSPWQSTQVALLDFENGTGSCAVEGDAATNQVITGIAPAGTYIGISFVNGVPEELNHADPATLQAPLQNATALSWGWLTGFRFVKAELRQTGAVETPGVGIVHVGATACSGDPQAGSVSCVRSNRNHILLDRFDPQTNTVTVDAAAIFAGTDLTQQAECQGAGSFCSTMFDALGIDIGTGQPSGAQTVFGVK